MNWKDKYVRLVIMFLFFWVAYGRAQDFRFDSTISKSVLENYLNRSIHYTELLHDDLSQAVDKRGVDPRDNIRALLNMGAKYVGRSIMNWGFEEDLTQYATWLKNAKRMIDTLHSVDPEMILEAAEFEIIDTQLQVLAVPATVFQTFGQTVVTRNFNYQSMLYDNGKMVNNWGTGASVPDMSKLETRMYYYFLACNYIDIGIEGFHFGQVGLMDQADPNHTYWLDMLTKVRAYARQHARRHMVLCNAHTPPSGNYVVNGNTLFDFNAFPLRIEQSTTTCCKGVLQVGYADALFTKSKGGVTPSGWSCTHLPWLAEFDNFGGSTPGVSSSAPFIWGYDEITWIAVQSLADRSAWLRYAKSWIAANDSACHLAMPGSRVLTHGPASSPNWYWSNTQSSACPKGFNTEDTIKVIWGTLTSGVNRAPNRTVVRSFSSNQKGLLVTVSGRIVRTFDSGHSAPADISSLKLPNGVYFYSCATASGAVSQGKIVINK